MTKELAKIDPVAEIKQVNDITAALMQQPHYKKLGTDGVFAVVSMAKSLGLDPLQAINGGLYPVGGKVEMTSQTMNQVIRQAGHSIKKDPKSNDEVCILHGRRADNGDTWTCSFSFEEAKRAGITIARDKYTKKIIDGPWQKYRQDMLFARALTRLARQLFPDVIRGCYIREHGQGEITASVDAEMILEPVEVTIDDEHVQHIEELLDDNDDLRAEALRLLKRGYDVDNFAEMPASVYDSFLPWLMDKVTKEPEVTYPGVEEVSA